VTHQRSKRTW